MSSPALQIIWFKRNLRWQDHAPLVLRVGEMTAVLEALRRNLGRFSLWSHEEPGNGWTDARDRAVAAWQAFMREPLVCTPEC